MVKPCHVVAGADSYLRSPRLQVSTCVQKGTSSNVGTREHQWPDVSGCPLNLRSGIPWSIIQKACGLFLNEKVFSVCCFLFL